MPTERIVLSEDPFVVESRGLLHFGRSRRKVCAGCGHHVSIHEYRPGSVGARDCRNCDCVEYLQPARYERIVRR